MKQTEYAKTSVSSVTSSVNISVGIIVIIDSVVISKYNFILSADKPSKKCPLYDKCEVNSEEFTSISQYNTYDSIDNSLSEILIDSSSISYN
jgi:hypothetical protein